MKNKKNNKNRNGLLSLRTKAEAVLVAGLLICIVAASVMSVTRTITDTSDNIVTFITDSNGRIWETDGTDDDVEIQAAIDNLDGENGTVWLAGNTDYSTSATIYVHYNCTIDFGYSTIFPDDDFDVFNLSDQGKICNGVIDLSRAASYSNTTAAIRIHGQTWSAGNPVGSTPAWVRTYGLVKQETVENIGIEGWLDGYTQYGIGIAIVTQEDNNMYGSGYFNNVRCNYLHKGIALEIHHDNTFITTPKFHMISGVGCRYFIYIDSNDIYTGPTGEEISEAIFNMVWFEAESNYIEYYPIFLNGTRNTLNSFTDVSFMDWLTNGDTTEYIRVNTSGCNDNYFSGVIRMGYVVDNGADNTFICGNTTLPALSVSNSKSTDHGINPGHGSDTGISFYFGTNENPYTYFYGDVAGTAKYGAFRITSNGNWNFISQTPYDICFNPGDDFLLFNDILQGTAFELLIYGDPVGGGTNRYMSLGWNSSSYPSGGFINTSAGDLNLSSANDVVTIDDVLNIKPQSGAPANPSLGDIYFESNNNTHCGWNGVAWKAFY